jgi:hypothetical protein
VAAGTKLSMDIADEDGFFSGTNTRLQERDEDVEFGGAGLRIL